MKLFKAVLISLLMTILILVFVGLIVGAVTGEVFGMFEYSVITQFFEGITAEALLTYLFTALVGIIPNLGPALFNFLKNVFGLVDKAANYFILVLSFLIAGIILLVTGSLELSGVEFTAVNLGAYGGTIYALSQVAYKQWLQPSG